MNRSTSTVAVIAMAIFVSTASAEFHWIEGEAAKSNSMRGHGWYDSVKKNELSGGAWLSHFHSGEMPVALYEVDNAEDGLHEFWLRANPIGSVISVRVNDGSWSKISQGRKEQQVNLASNGQPDLRFVAWIKAEPIHLQSGRNKIEVRFESDNNRHGGLDCFVLSTEPFFPQGKLKPGQKTGMADPGTWAFEPDRDRFSTDALLDLTALNEKPAGKHGRIARSSDGADFVDGAGKPIRFWAVNTSVQYRDDLAAVEEHAKFLAKRGVNMVRHHGHLAPKGDDINAVNQKDIEAAWRLVAAMKKQGIYVTLSPYWAVSVKYNPAWGIKSPDGDNLTGLLFFDEKLQQAYKGWLRKLLTPPNPHTGVSLAEDPTLAIFQIQNEDSLLFWTEGAIKGQQRVELGRKFGSWLIEKYDSIEQATSAWGGAAGVQGDDFKNGIVMPQQIYHLTQTQKPGPNASRLNDQLQFYTELMHRFNSHISRFLKEEIGYHGLINAGNWKTANQDKLLDAERYSYTANDVIGVNRYYSGGKHINPAEKHKAGYLVSQGDRFSGESAIKRFWEFPVGLRQVDGYPMMISESAWVSPLRFQSEGPFLVAAYGSLTGFDIFYWFATSEIGFGPPMGKWQMSTPAQMGMFPAAALMFRKGYIQEGKPALVERRSLEELWSRKAPRLSEEAGFDPNRDSQFETQANSTGSLSPKLYLRGPVRVRFEGDRSSEETVDSSFDFSGPVVESNTGQLKWNHVDGVCTLNAPKAQGACGDLSKAAVIKIESVALKSSNSYASVLAVAMDDMPLKTSSKVLVQVGTAARPYGWRSKDVGNGEKEITDLGSSPWNIEETQCELVVLNPSLSKATQLDANGIAVKDIPVETNGRFIKLRLPKDAMYVVLR